MMLAVFATPFLEGDNVRNQGSSELRSDRSPRNAFTLRRRMPEALLEIGRRAVSDAELILPGFPPVACRRAQRETADRSRSKPDIRGSGIVRRIHGHGRSARRRTPVSWRELPILDPKNDREPNESRLKICDCDPACSLTDGRRRMAKSSTGTYRRLANRIGN